MPTRQIKIPKGLQYFKRTNFQKLIGSEAIVDNGTRCRKIIDCDNSSVITADKHRTRYRHLFSRDERLARETRECEYVLRLLDRFRRFKKHWLKLVDEYELSEELNEQSEK